MAPPHPRRRHGCGRGATSPRRREVKSARPVIPTQVSLPRPRSSLSPPPLRGRDREGGRTKRLIVSSRSVTPLRALDARVLPPQGGSGKNESCSVYWARSIVAAALSRPGLHILPCTHEVAEQGSPEGGGAPKSAKPFGVRVRRRTRRAPSGAPHAHLRRSVSACYFAAIFRSTPGRAFAVSVPLPRQRTEVKVTLGACVRTETVRDLTVVSQLLAGPRSGHGRSPGAARVPGCEPDPRAPRPVPPHDAS
jgi:hypothetical protein